jgi:MerR HTH family regulatory protein
MSIDDDDEPFYPGSTTLKKSAGGSGPAIPEDEQTWERYGREYLDSQGRRIMLYSISALAEALERDVKTMRHWDKYRILPPCDSRTDSASEHGRWRLYTHAQLVGLRRIAKEEGLLSGKRVFVQKTQFTAKAEALFAELEKADDDD